MVLKQKKYGFFDIITLSFKTSPFYSLIYAFKEIIAALLPTLSIYITANFLNSAVKVFNKQADITSIYMSVALFAMIMIYNAMIDAVFNFVNVKQVIFFRSKLSPEIISKHAKLEYYNIENPETLDLITRVSKRFDVMVWSMYTQLLGIVKFALYIAGIMITLFMQVWWLAIVLFIISIPIMYISMLTGKKGYELEREMTKIDRKTDYLSSVMKSRDAVEERSLYGYTERLNTKFAEKFTFSLKFRLKMMRSNIFKTQLGGLLAKGYSVFAMIVMFTSVIAGNMNFGMFISLTNAIFGVSDRLSWGVNILVEDLSQNLEYLKDLTKFMELDEDENSTDQPEKNMKFKVLEFRNVIFKYPGTEKLVLDNVSFKIENGKHYAFVGVNGAGKTTITKLITGLYKNYEGEILLNGRRLSDLTSAQIKGLSSVVYQDFAKYYISLYDNIAISDLGGTNTCDKVEDAVKLVGLSSAVGKLKYGLDTTLGKVLENGVDVSGGEWQRIAMARSIVSDAPLKIFDEPTAALDPVSESMMYRNFEQISKGMATIFISHRLGSTKLADIIYVLSDGKIIESGSHSDLIKLNGKYKEMFDSQSEWYKNTNEEGELVTNA